jgi:hypothetical protein
MSRNLLAVTEFKDGIAHVHDRHNDMMLIGTIDRTHRFSTDVIYFGGTVYESKLVVLRANDTDEMIDKMCVHYNARIGLDWPVERCTDMRA